MTLHGLIELLRREQKVHEQLLVAKREERKLLILVDAAGLLKNTERISDLTGQAHELEEQRQKAVLAIGHSLGLTRERVFLKDILVLLPDHDRVELENAGIALKRILLEIRETNRSNTQSLRHSIDLMNTHLTEILPKKETSGVYTSRGVRERPPVPRIGLNLRA